jgi:hypothetical protein
MTEVEQAESDKLDMMDVSPVYGRYIYGIAGTGVARQYGKIGLNGEGVRTIPYRGICAVVHDCIAQPYQSQKREIVEAWVQTHQRVLDAVKESLGTVIPFGFDIIIKAPEGKTDTDQVIVTWLMQNYDKLTGIIENIKGKDEYGIQIYYQPEAFRDRVIQTSLVLKQMQTDVSTKPAGMAYLQRQQMEKALKAEIEKVADRHFTDFFEKIKLRCAEVVVDKPGKPDKGKLMLMNLSCLVASQNVDGLGQELETITQLSGLSVSFTGPWPPYSFVSDVKAVAERFASEPD